MITMVEIVVAGPQGVQGTAGTSTEAGGATNQVLMKRTATDYDAKWDFVNAADTVFTSTSGIAASTVGPALDVVNADLTLEKVKIAGNTTAVGAAQAQADLGVANAATAQTQADLGVANAATAQTTADGALVKTANLFDLGSAVIARTNLGVTSTTDINAALAGKIDDSQVLTNVPAGALFTDTTYTVGDAGLTEINFTSALNTKLGAIEPNAKDDQTAPEVVYDNTISGLTATDVKVAIDEVSAGVDTNTSGIITAQGTADTALFNTLNMTSDEIATIGHIGTPTLGLNLHEMNNLVNTSGVIDGCTLTDNGNGTVSVATGTALVRAIADSTAPLFAVSTPQTLNIILTDNSMNYIYVDYNNGSPILSVTTNQDDIDCLIKCLVFIVHRAGLVLHHIDDRQHGIDVSRKSRAVFRGFSRFIHAAGGTVLSTAGTFGLAVTAGSFFYTVTKLPHVAFNTNIAGTANENIFHLFYRDAGAGWTQIDDSKTIDPTKYDDGSGTLATLPLDTDHGVAWVYMINNSPSGLAVVVGQEVFANQAEAENATPPAVLPSLLEGMGSLIGFAVFKKTGTTFANVLSAYSQTFSTGFAQSHNTLSGIQGGAVNDYLHVTQDEHDKHMALGWRDNVQPFSARVAAGTVEPSWEDIGNGIYAYRFTPGEEAFVTFHVDHDYALGTDAYTHIHFISDQIINAGETLVWEIGYTRARSHSQGESLTGVFTTFQMTYTAPVGGTIAGEHILLECDPLYAFDLFEPDTLILMRAHLVSTTTAGRIFGLQCDLHYQADRDNTPSKVPNFYV